MSEYQYSEFLAIDRPLEDRQQAEVRSLSTRAAITATNFINEYHWGDFRGDPSRMMERYYDTHLYLTNWGTHRIMLRLPREPLDIDVTEDHCIGDHVTVWTTGDFLVLDMTSEDNSGDGEHDPQRRLSAIRRARTELAARRAGTSRPSSWLAKLRRTTTTWLEQTRTCSDRRLSMPTVS